MSEPISTRFRMSKEELEAMKKKILMYVTRSKFPVTPTEVSNELPVCYPTALAMMMELALEGHLKLRNRSGERCFMAAPDITLTIKESS